MRYRPLGSTGLEVSEVSLGTVELGLDYGFRESRHYPRPSFRDAVRLVHEALDLGINLLDTARSYGESEAAIGRALREWPGSQPVIVSKVYLPDGASNMSLTNLRAEIIPLVETSLNMLGVEALDMLLIHNTQQDHLHRSDIVTCLQQVQQQGKVRFLGVSCAADEELCFQVLEHSEFRALQVPFNLLNQKMRRRVFDRATERGVAVFVRSAYLRGLLTNQMSSAPSRLDPLKSASVRIQELADRASHSLSETALRFCLSYPSVSSVVIGVKTIEELRANLTDAQEGALPKELLSALESQSMEDDPLVDTTKWQDLI
jgi:aryl-alcohol dehydrogenase-like predicted oxidoreductase